MSAKEARKIANVAASPPVMRQKSHFAPCLYCLLLQVFLFVIVHFLIFYILIASTETTTEDCKDDGMAMSYNNFGGDYSLDSEIYEGIDVQEIKEKDEYEYVA